MPRQRVVKTQAEEALEQYHWAETIRDNSRASGEIDGSLGNVRVILMRAGVSLSPFESWCALRDYAQYRIAILMDEKAAETQARIDELSTALADNHTKLKRFSEGD